jgi:hypothetical protein
VSAALLNNDGNGIPVFDCQIKKLLFDKSIGDSNSELTEICRLVKSIITKVKNPLTPIAIGVSGFS